MELQGQTAIVTGAGRNIGRAIALELAGMGADVVVAEVDRATGERTAEEVRKRGRRAMALQTDVTRLADLQAMADRAMAEWGRIDILVNNAGLLRDNLSFKMSEDDWDKVLDVHLKGSFLCSKAAQKYMVEQEYGKIVMTSSIVALGNKGQANYSAAKAGLQALARTLALELGRFNINVNAVAPGWIETEMTKEAAERVGMTMEEMKGRFEKNIPLKRFGRVEDIANVVAFLVSDDASYISGETIYVSGGPSSSVI
jgi:3-oxoacyl-[acyl-carrier protein] reductase